MPIVASAGAVGYDEHRRRPKHLPPGLRHETYVPFSWLLPQAIALVSHGGIGTIAQGMRAGIPQLLAHVNFDQRDNGSRLEALEVGAHLSVKKFRGARAVQTLSSLIQSDMSTTALELSNLIDPDRSVAAASEAIEAAASRT